MEHLQLPDLIRMNKLIRGGIQHEAFDAWYTSLPAERRVALTYFLAEFAFEAGVDAEVARTAQAIAERAAECPGTKLLLEYHRERTSAHLLAFLRWLESADAENQRLAFEFAVALFGVAEGRVYANETAEYCNHWWHRDLTNPEVEADLLRDPAYSRTSKSTDRRVTDKGPLGRLIRWWHA